MSDERTLTGYRTCTMCCLGHHGKCDNRAYIYHVGGDVPEVVPCECKVCHACFGSGWVVLYGSNDMDCPSHIAPAVDPGDKYYLTEDEPF